MVGVLAMSRPLPFLSRQPTPFLLMPPPNEHPPKIINYKVSQVTMVAPTQPVLHTYTTGIITKHRTLDKTKPKWNQAPPPFCTPSKPHQGHPCVHSIQANHVNALHSTISYFFLSPCQWGSKSSCER